VLADARQVAGLTKIGSTEGPKLDVPVDQLGPAGIRGELHILAIMPDERRSDDARLADRALRTFAIAATLSKQPPATGDLKGDFDAGEGASYFVAPPGVDHHRIDTAGGRFFIRLNDRGELALIEFSCEARDVAEAQAKFAAAVHPCLDHLAYIANVPVHVGRLRLDDAKNGRTTLAFTGPFRDATIGTFAHQFAPEMQPIYSMYREARNASSDFYRFLCFFKILEGLLGKMRAEVFRRAKARGVTLVRPHDHVPPGEYGAALQDRVGKSVKQFFDDVLEPEYRNAMAHFAADDGTVLHLSDYSQQLRYADIMLITEQCVRTVIANHEALLTQLA